MRFFLSGPWWVRTVNELADSEAAAFYRHRVFAEVEQAIGRLRGNRRPGENLTIYVLSDYPLARPVRVVHADALAPEATSRAVATDRLIEQAIAQLQKLGDCTLSAIAKLAKVSLSRVSKSLPWKSYQERVSEWFVDFPNAIKNIATKENHKPPRDLEPEQLSEVKTEELESVPKPESSVQAQISSEPEEVQQAYWDLRTIWSADGLLRVLTKYGREVCSRAAKYQTPVVKRDLKRWKAILKREGRL